MFVGLWDLIGILFQLLPLLVRCHLLARVDHGVE